MLVRGMVRAAVFSVMSVAALVLADPGRLAASEPLLVPSTMCQGLFLVSAEFKGEELSLVLDTGADGWSLDPDAVERVTGRPSRHGKKVTLRKGTMGPLKLNKIKARVHELDHLALALRTPIDGIIGFNTFADFLLVLDYREEKVWVEFGALPPVDGFSIFEDYGETRPFIRLELGASAVPLLIDSGFAGGLDLNLDDEISWESEPTLVSVAVKYSSVELQKAGRMSMPLQVGPLKLRRPVIRVSEGTRLLGAQLLQHMRLTFDQENKRIGMEAYDRQEIGFEPYRDWGIGFRPRRAGLEVMGVFKQSPAEAAGIRQGDMLVSVDGVPVHERGCRQLSDPEPERALMSFLRDGEEFQVELETAVLVP